MFRSDAIRRSEGIWQPRLPFSSHADVVNEEYFGLLVFRKKPIYSLFKRLFDIVFSLVCLIITSPVILLVAVIIKIESSGPVIFSQMRSGINCKPFKMYKFRSMVHDAEKLKGNLAEKNEMDGPVFKIKDDPRVTRFGRFLRTWSLDELPQLINILKGDMHIVGPRPLPVLEVTSLNEYQIRRHSVKPGLTCIWQISGRNEIPFSEWIQLDLLYIANRSFFLDLEIITRTVFAVLSRRGAR